MDDPREAWTRTAAPARPALRRWRWLLLALAALAAVMVWLSWALPLDRALEPLPKPTLVLLDRHGTAFARRGALKLEPVDARRLPRHVVDAVLSIEDRRFYRHHGVDARAVYRAAWHNLRARALVEGGSTITQQLAKTSFLDPERTLRRKLQEALVALWLEARLDKDEILSRYLSGIYFGDGVYGLRAASRHYFDVEPEALDLSQAALLAGLIKAPSALAPTRHPEAAARRARVVLDAMVANGKLEPGQARALPPARVKWEVADLPVGSYFADWMSAEAREATEAAYGEMRVRTTLDLRLQALAERVAAAHARELASVGASQLALVAMRPDGEVVAMLGGRDYAASPYNRATQAKRQPGSAFKLFVYYAAIKQGMRPDDSVQDAPVTVAGWTPANHDGRYLGAISLREAFAQSSNAAAVRIAQEVGTARVVRAARELGVRSELGTDASLALGSYETTLLELTSAYAAFARGEAPVQPRGVLENAPPGRTRPLDPSERGAMLELLSSAVESGTARAARLPIAAFGKTGTTQDHRDALFVGMAGDLVTGVWVGNDDNAPMQGVTGGSLPARIWRDFMARAARGRGPMPASERAWRASALPEPVRRLERSSARFERRHFSRQARAHGRGHGKGKGKHKRR